jgi:hypothetical protein
LAEFDINKLSTGDKVIGIGAIFYLISMFLPWYGFDVPSDFSGGTRSFNNNGWSFFLGAIIPLILILAVTAVVAIKKFSPETKLPDLPVPWSQALLIAAGAAAVIVLLRLAIASDDFAGISTGISADRKFGLFIAVLASIAVAVGAFLKYQTKEDDAGAAPSGPPSAF